MALLSMMFNTGGAGELRDKESLDRGEPPFMPQAVYHSGDQKLLYEAYDRRFQDFRLGYPFSTV
jgi:hypothetical protein